MRLRWDLQVALVVGIVFGVGALAVALVVSPIRLGPDSTMLPDRPGAAWVSIDPIQCMGNPWEEDWLRSHDNGTWQQYPPDWESRRMIIMDYYAGIGLPVLDARQDSWNDEVCDACSCPAGYTLYLQVWDHQVDDFVALGYEAVP